MELLGALADALAPDTPVETGCGIEAIEADDAWLDAMLARDEGGHRQRLWTNSRCLVTTRRFARSDRFAAAANESALSGWPVHVRASGGTTVVHRPGMLNYSAFAGVDAADFDLNRTYRDFCDHVVAAIGAIGVDAGIGAIEGSYCDGRFNIVSRGRKIAGTASLVRLKTGRVASMMHAAICVEGDVRADVAAVARFERSLGLRPVYRPRAHAALSDLIRFHAA